MIIASTGLKKVPESSLYCCGVLSPSSQPSSVAASPTQATKVLSDSGTPLSSTFLSAQETLCLWTLLGTTTLYLLSLRDGQNAFCIVSLWRPGAQCYSLDLNGLLKARFPVCGTIGML